MTHFVYAYKDDGHDGRELRYSLRGLDAHWVGEAVVTIVGDRPSWCGPDVYLEAPTIEGAKVKNILTAVFTAADFLNRSNVEQAVYLDDDYMLLDYQGEIYQTYKESWSEFYGRRNRLKEPNFEWFLQAMDATQRYVGARPVEGKSFELHRPMLFSPQGAVQLLDKFLDKEPEATPFWRSMYGNFANRYPLFQARDVRASSAFPRGTAWVSTDALYWRTAGPELERRLIAPSRWERA